MVLMAVAFIPSLFLGVLAAGAVWRWPRVDPASPRVATHPFARYLEHRPALDDVLRRRFDPGTATGLLLSVAVAALVLGAVVFGMLIYMVRRERGLASFDVRIAQWAADHATELSTDVMRIVTHLGGSLVLFPLTVVIAVIAYTMSRRAAVFAFLALAVLGQNALSNLIKWIIDRVRPDIDPLAGFSGPSFPSGHTTAAAACFAAFALVLGRGAPRTVKAMLAGVAVAIAIAVGATRVLLGVHWFTDVLGGLALGWAWFALCSIAFGGRLLHFGAPVEVAERALDTERLHEARGAS